VRLLTAPLSLARESLRLTLRAWEFGLSTAADAARIGLELLDPDRDDSADFARRSDSVQPDERRPQEAEAVPPTAAAAPPRTTTHAPPAPDAPPRVPDELIPDHVDEDPVLVAEAAEEGAEYGAGPELRVEPPWDGYDRMTAADIRDRLAVVTATEAAAVELYESRGKSRRAVLDAAERAQRGLL
jgi:hypothetical protein